MPFYCLRNGMEYDIELERIGIEIQESEKNRENHPVGALKAYVTVMRDNFPRLANYLNKNYDSRYKPDSLSHADYQDWAISHYLKIHKNIASILEEIKFADDGMSARYLAADDVLTLTEVFNQFCSLLQKESFSQLSWECKHYVNPEEDIPKIINELCLILYWHTTYVTQLMLNSDPLQSAINRAWSENIVAAFAQFLPHLGEALISQKCFKATDLITPVCLFREIIRLRLQYTDQALVFSQLKELFNQRSSHENRALFKTGTGKYDDSLTDFYRMLSHMILLDVPQGVQVDAKPDLAEVNETRYRCLQALYYAIMMYNCRHCYQDPEGKQLISYIKARAKPFLPQDDIDLLSLEQLKNLPAFSAILPELVAISKRWNMPLPQDRCFEKSHLLFCKKEFLLFETEMDKQIILERRKQEREQGYRNSLQMLKQTGPGYVQRKLLSENNPVEPTSNLSPV